MPGGQTRFNSSWLVDHDRNGQALSDWCDPSKQNNYAGFCRVCKKDVRCDNQGLHQLLRHADTLGHKSHFVGRARDSSDRLLTLQDYNNEAILPYLTSTTSSSETPLS